VQLVTLHKMGKKESDPYGIPHERAEPRPDFSKPLPPVKLPASIQQALDDDEKMWEVLDEKQYDIHTQLTCP
jgi:mitochondrial fission process protein 1